MLAIYPDEGSYPLEYSWAALARISTNGHICTLYFPTLKGMRLAAAAKKKDVQLVWEIMEKLTIKTFPGKEWKNIGGGRKEDPKTTWQEAYEDGLNQIC